MTMHVLASERMLGRSGEVRACWPEGESELHPRAAEMAEAMREVGPGCTFRDLLRRGFTSAEIVEHVDDAEKHAKGLWERQATMRPDMVADIIAKARVPLPNDPPLTRDMKETQPLLVAWGSYCQARQALVVDPWTGQRDRALKKLSAYLDRMPIFPRIRDEILQAVSAHLPKVPA